MKAIPAMLAMALLAAPIALPRDYSIHAVPMTAVFQYLMKSYLVS